jgi:hypothetical protein
MNAEHDDTTVIVLYEHPQGRPPSVLKTQPPAPWAKSRTAPRAPSSGAGAAAWPTTTRQVGQGTTYRGKKYVPLKIQYSTGGSGSMCAGGHMYCTECRHYKFMSTHSCLACTGGRRCL